MKTRLVCVACDVVVGPEPRCFCVDNYSDNNAASFSWVPTTTASSKTT